MFRRGLALTLVLGMASVVQAGAVLEAVPSPSSNPYNPCGYYDVGEVVTVEFFLNQAPPDVDQELRMVHVRLDGTDAALGLGSFAWDSTFATAHYTDVDPAAGPAGVSAAYTYEVDTDLGPNPAAQLTLPGGGSAVSIGTMDVTMPGTAGDYILDTTGSEVSFGFEIAADPTAVTYWSTGGTTTLSVIDQALIATATADQKNLWRTEKNIARFTFDTDLGAVGAVALAGQVEVVELLAGGAFGADISANFNFFIEDAGAGPKVLMLQDTGANMPEAWYAIRNVGAWGAVAPFVVQYRVIPGDADDNGFVTPTDVGVINDAIGPQFVDDSRFDVTGNTFVTPTDVGLANDNIGPGPQKPSGHECD